MASTRRLAAILAADVAGYSRLMGADEEGTHERLKAHLRDLVDPKIKEHRGRIVKNTGDGFLAEFASVLDAVRCAVEIQRGMADRDRELSEDNRISFRIGVNPGDVIVEPEDIFGDGVNIAARLEALAEPGGICVSGTVCDHIGGRLPYVFEDMGEQLVKNIARPVRVHRVVLGERPSPSEAAMGKSTKPSLALPDKPSIAVLPFQNMSGDPEQEYFADGMVEEITTALSRIRWLFVIARNSSFTYKGQAVDVKQVGRELGVRYLLEGSVRKAGGRVRITAQLIEAETTSHLWADRFDGSLDDVFDLQDQVATSVAGVIEPTLQAAEIGRSIRRPTVDLTAYDLYLRALALQYSPRDEFAQAFDLLGQAVGRDPQYGSALALTAHWYYRMDMHRWSQDVQTTRRNGLDFARRALRHDPENPEVLSRAAFVLGYFGEDVHTAIALIDRCLELNSNYAMGWYRSGILRNWAGQPEVALKHFDKYLELNPRGRHAAYLTAICISLFFCGRFEEAVARMCECLEHWPDNTLVCRFLAASYAHLGRLAEAREIVQRLGAAVSDDGSRFQSAEHREMYLSGLRLAVGE